MPSNKRRPRLCQAWQRLLILVTVVFFVVPIWVNFFDWYEESRKQAAEEMRGSSTNANKVVWVMSYMRSGSSYISRSLFGSNPDIFFVFEPLASLYVSMYGLSMDMAVSTDIVNNPDGSPRQLPKHEYESVLWTLRQVFSCQMTSFSSHMLGHVYWSWTHQVAETLYPCLGEGTVNGRQIALACWGHLKDICGSRLGQPGVSQDTCYQQLWEQFYKSGFKVESTNSTHEGFVPFHNCWSRLKPFIYKCAHHFQHPCNQKRVTAVKTVRASMEVAGPLLAENPELQVIYLYRDPRSVVRSRLQYPWSQGLFDGANATLIARAYCQRILQDHSQKIRLQKQYPGRIMTLTYDQFADNSMLNAKRVYDFLDLPFPEQNVWDYLMIRRKQKDPLKVRDKWRTELTETQVNSIQSECAEFAKVLRFDWNKR